MTTIINTILPLVILLAAGNIMRRKGFLTDEFWQACEKLTYYVLMPVLLVRVISTAEFDGDAMGPAVASVYTGVIAAAGICYAIYAVFKARMGAPLFTSVFQGAIRYNTYIAFAVVETLYGSGGLALAGVLAGFKITLVNIFCVTTLEICLSAGAIKPMKILRGLATNPLVLGCLGGGLLNVTNFPVPEAVGGAMDLLSRMALPVALLCAGAALQVRRLKGDLTPALVSGAVALLIKPAIAGVIAVQLGISGPELVVLVLMMSAPTAASGYILARKMGGDHEAMATIIAFQTVAGMLTLPLVMLAVGV